MNAAHSRRIPLTSVATVLSPDERARVDAAGDGLYTTIHRDSVDDVLRDLRRSPVGAVLVSVARCDSGTTSRVATMVREFPRVPAVALLTQLERDSARAVLALGQSGVQTLIDVRHPAGWAELRRVLLADRGDELRRLALSALSIDLAGVPEDCWRFFETLFTVSPRTSTVRDLSRELAVLPSTMMSRFFRAGLPAPKRYLACARLVRAARLLENAGYSLANVANHLEYSSPQSFGRHIRNTLGISAGDFRRSFDGRSMLDAFRRDLVLPYRAKLACFRPLLATPPWVASPTRRNRRGAEHA
jgi:AraC-like DNA-binding protein